MSTTQAQLEHLGLSAREAAVYDAALSLGPSSALRISRVTKVPRATVYLVLRSLDEKGLVTSRHENSTTIFTAAPPAALNDFLNSREREIDKGRSLLRDLIPQLQSQWSDNEDVTKSYVGIDQLRRVHADLIMHAQNGDMWYRLMPVDRLIDVFGVENFFWDKSSRAKGVHTRVLFTTSYQARRQQLLASQNSRHHVKELPHRLYSSNTSITVCRDRAVIEALRNKGEVTGLVIASDMIAGMLRDILRILWIHY